MKNNKGLTLIALIVSIIVLLIFAGVTINAVLGENGVLARARESSVLTNIADTLFDLESEVVSINADNLDRDPKLTSTEMITELIDKKKLSETDSSYLYGAGSGSLVMEAEITNGKPRGLKLGFNGDVWLDNYKRGKINLSSEINTAYSDDKKVKITVIDGTVEKINSNEFYLRSLDRKSSKKFDFVCWINQYGEIVSDSKNTIIYKFNPGEYEYTAVYSYDLKKEVINNKDYVLFGIESFINKQAYSYSLEIQSTYFDKPYCYVSEVINESGEGEFTTLVKYGTRVNALGFAISDNYNDLINIDGIKWQFDTMQTTSNFYDEYITIPMIYEDVPTASGDGYYAMLTDLCTEGAYYQVKENEFLYFVDNNSEYLRTLSYVYGQIPEEVINSYKEKGIKRLYYRGVVWLNILEPALYTVPGEPRFNFIQKEDGSIKEYTVFESAIKYFDL